MSRLRRFVDSAMAGDGADGNGFGFVSGVAYRPRWGCAITVVNPDDRIAFYYDPPRQPIALSNGRTDSQRDSVPEEPVSRSDANAAVSGPDSE